MPLMSVPFKLPAPYPLPVGLTQTLQGQPVDQNVEAIMHMLIEEGMADVALLEVAEGDALSVKAVQARQPEPFRPLVGVSETSGDRFSAKALEAGSSLLIMGDLDASEAGLRPAFVDAFLAGRPQADLGFAYVLPLIGEGGKRHGVLTLVRGDGPLNHDQPAIVQAFGQWLAHRFDQSVN
ncbi:hypothetical protein D3C87_1211830 [compost metagenome]